MPPTRRRPPARPLFLALALPALLLLPYTSAHPFLYKGPFCDSHPTQALGRHDPPRADPATTFELRSPRGRVVTGVCPGVAYTLSVAFGWNETRKVLMTAGLGKLANSTNECPGREATGEMMPVVRTVWTLPCSVPSSMAAAVTAAGPSGAIPVELRATSASGPNGAYWQARASVPLRMGCVTNGCRSGGGPAAAKMPAARFSGAAPPPAG